MEAKHMTQLIEGLLAGFPKRMSGNEEALRLAAALRPMLPAERRAVCGALEGYLAYRRRWFHLNVARREARIGIALLLAEEFELRELASPVGELACAAEMGRVLSPMRAEWVRRVAASLG
jgi:hypothetical protein